MLVLKGLVRDVEELDVAVLPRRIRAERLHEIGEAVDLDGREAVAGGRCVVADRAVEHFVAGEVRGVLIQIAIEPIGGDDDGILLEAPAWRFLLSRAGTAGSASRCS